MLPDFPEVREAVDKFLKEYFEWQRSRGIGVMQRVRTVVLHEGNRMELIRWDGTTERKPMEQIASRIELARDTIEKEGLGAVLEAINKTAADLAEKQVQFFFRRIKEIVEETDQTIDAKGRPFDYDLMLEALEAVAIDFDENGCPNWPTFVCNPKMFEKARAWEVTNDQKRRFDELTQRKRLAWRDRESHRKLVS